jgi:outer membrane receptor protein involved in Fe transport
MQAYFSKVSTNTVQEPGPITSGWSVNIYPQYNRAVIPTDLLAILDSRANPNGAVSLRAMLPVPRETITDTTTFSVIAGIEGKIPGIDWTWELFTSHGEAQTYAQSIGYTSLKRTKMVIGGYYTQMRLNAAGQPVDQFGNVVTDPSAAKWDEITLPGYKNFGQGFRMKANPEDGGFGAATATCTSGLNPFDYSGMTPDCWDAIKADVKTRMLTEQDIFELNLQGGIIDLPAGEMRGAIGASERLNEFKFLSDNINSERQSFNDTILGLYPAQDSIGSLEVKEYYGELLVPVLKDIPFVKALNLELGARSSDYDTTGKSRTYKALADWRILDWIRFRGGYNKAERAPNIAELYLNPEQTFGVMSYGDVCWVRNRVAPVTANPDFNDEWYEVVKICGQLMDKVGTDLDVTYYYKQNWETIYNYGVANPGATGASLHGPDTNANGLPDDGFLMTDTAYNDGFYQTTGGFGFLWPINVGNDELGPETANTWTAGIVFDSPFEHPALSNFRVSIDWYQIAIKDAIGEQSADMVMMMCVDPAFNPGYDINNYSCQGMNRDPRFGTLGQVVKSFYNGGEFETSGIDVNINYSLDLGPGTFMWNTNFNCCWIRVQPSLLVFLPVSITPAPWARMKTASRETATSIGQ